MPPIGANDDDEDIPLATTSASVLSAVGGVVGGVVGGAVVGAVGGAIGNAVDGGGGGGGNVELETFSTYTYTYPYAIEESKELATMIPRVVPMDTGFATIPSFVQSHDSMFYRKCSLLRFWIYLIYSTHSWRWLSRGFDAALCGDRIWCLFLVHEV